MQLHIDPHGTLQCVYSETIDLASLGSLLIHRASHVEPDAHGRWCVDLSPIGGPRLASFPLRSQALDAERAWLEEHWPAQLAIADPT